MPIDLDDGAAESPLIDIGHEVGDNNIEVMGLDIHNPVFIISAVSVIALVAITLAFPTITATLFLGTKAWVTSSFET